MKKRKSASTSNSLDGGVKKKRKTSGPPPSEDENASSVESDDGELPVRTLHVDGDEKGCRTIGPNIEFSAPVPNSAIYFGCGAR